MFCAAAPRCLSESRVGVGLDWWPFWGLCHQADDEERSYDEEDFRRDREDCDADREERDQPERNLPQQSPPTFPQLFFESRIFFFEVVH